LDNRIKNIEGWSTSSEETPEYFGAKGALSFKNENIMCDRCIRWEKYFVSQLTSSTKIISEDVLSGCTVKLIRVHF
jgi:hypothetical protein